MKLRPITESETDNARAMLVRGFPAMPESAWPGILGKLFRYCESVGENSIGQMIDIGGDAGICLVIPAEHAAFGKEPRRVANISSFFLDEKHQWMAPLAMRRVMTSADVVYTDLSATPAMRKINEKLGFLNHSQGSVLIPLPAAALTGGSGARIVPLGAVPHGRLSDSDLHLLRAHDELGCIVAGLDFAQTFEPLIFARTRRRGVPGARVVLASNRRMLAGALGAIARFLLAKGLMFLEFEAASRDGFPLALFWRRSPPFQSTREPDGEAIDHTFSELVFFQRPFGRMQGSG